MSYIAKDKAQKVLEFCRDAHLRLATIESCTGGLIAASLTDIAGSSDVVTCGFVTYSNAMKNQLVGVSEQLLNTYGAVSKEVAIAMAEGGIKHSDADIAISVTGVAGPNGGSIDKPVGLVHMAVARKNHPTRHFEARFGALTRQEIRQKTVERALELIIEI